MPIDKNDLTVRENRILKAALDSHLGTLEEMAADPNYQKTDGSVQVLVADILATESLLKDLKRRKRR